MLGQESHLNTSFKHFIYFTREFTLIETKEMAPLQELIDALMEKDNNNRV
jgi:MOB kinase activator 1